jgi:uncharacterized LabA/DUF88 family protein
MGFVNQKMPILTAIYPCMNKTISHLSGNHAAIFLDFENILYHLKKEYADPPQVNDVIMEILRSLRNYFIDQLKLEVIIFKAYADFERMPNALGSLYLMGIDTHNVLGTDHKNAADMRLCIDLMEVLYTRPDIQHYVLVAGDRDYIPLVQHLRRQARQVKAVAFRQTVSGDLLQILGIDNLLEADQFIGDASRRDLLKHKNTVVNSIAVKVVDKIVLPEPKKSAVPAAQPALAEGVAVAEKTAAPLVKKPLPRTYDAPGLPAFFNVKNITHKYALDCLRLLLEFVDAKNVNEVWLSPFLRFLTDAMPLLADYERKEQINTLGIYGAIKVEKRTGDTFDFSVILINYNHPDVISLMP